MALDWANTAAISLESFVGFRFNASMERLFFVELETSTDFEVRTDSAKSKNSLYFSK